MGRRGRWMYKTTAEAMMRGAGPRVTRGPKKRFPPFNTNGKTKSSDIIQFGETKAERDAFLLRLRPLVRQAREQGCSTASRLATFLNSHGCTTASGERWTTRRAVVLRRLLYERHKAAQAGKNAKPAPPPVPPRSSPEPNQLLTREELARRLNSLGRVSGA